MCLHTQSAVRRIYCYATDNRSIILVRVEACDRNVAVLAETIEPQRSIQRRVSVVGSETRIPDRNVRLSIAIIIALCRNMRLGAEIDLRNYTAKALKDEPAILRSRSHDCEVGFAVAVIVARDDEVAKDAERLSSEAGH